MKRILPPLMGVMLCVLPLHSAMADPAVSLQTKEGEELHAAVTDMPAIIDMSHADPKTWHSLPSAAQVYDQSAPSRAAMLLTKMMARGHR
jgi:hypothetical protein